MNTDDLVDLLARHAPAVDPDLPERQLRRALGLGSLVALLVVVWGLRVRSDLGSVLTEPMLWVKWAYPLALGWSGWQLTQRLSRPGAALGAWTRGVWVPGALMLALSAAVWFDTPAPDRTALVLGRTWTTCSVSIVLLSLPVLVACLGALRWGAPTHLARSGAAAGLLSGAAGAAVYALHCPEMSAPFLFVWNGLGMLGMAGLGAWLGPRVLRW